MVIGYHGIEITQHVDIATSQIREPYQLVIPGLQIDYELLIQFFDEPYFILNSTMIQNIRSDAAL